MKLTLLVIAVVACVQVAFASPVDPRQQPAGDVATTDSRPRIDLSHQHAEPRMAASPKDLKVPKGGKLYQKLADGSLVFKQSGKYYHLGLDGITEAVDKKKVKRSKKGWILDIPVHGGGPVYYPYGFGGETAGAECGDCGDCVGGAADACCGLLGACFGG